MRPPRALLASFLAALAALAVVPGAPAAGGEADRWDVPRRAWITIQGHGYGHGHGMSQYGAEGAAREGLGFREIVEFYYPGTRWGTSRGRVAVLITAATSDQLVVLARSGLTLRDAGTGKAVILPDKDATRWRLRTDDAGSTRVAWYDGRWRGFRTLEGAGAFEAPGKAVRLVTPSGTPRYRGRLWLRAGDTVNVLRMENYLRGVVPLEVPALWSAAAVRAQAVAARTYAAYERAHPRASHYQLCDTWSCQVYGGADAEHEASDAAIEATAGLSLKYDGGPAFTQFGSSSGGWTSAGSVPYLPAQQDPYDGWSGNPHHAWSWRVKDTLIESKWPAIGNLKRLVVGERDGHGDWGGRVRSLTLVGSEGRVTVSGDTLRAVLGLRSTWVTFKVTTR